MGIQYPKIPFMVQATNGRFGGSSLILGGSGQSGYSGMTPDVNSGHEALSHAASCLV